MLSSGTRAYLPTLLRRSSQALYNLDLAITLDGRRWTYDKIVSALILNEAALDDGSLTEYVYFSECTTYHSADQPDAAVHWAMCLPWRPREVGLPSTFQIDLGLSKPMVVDAPFTMAPELRGLPLTLCASVRLSLHLHVLKPSKRASSRVRTGKPPENAYTEAAPKVHVLYNTSRLSISRAADVLLGPSEATFCARI